MNSERPEDFKASFLNTVSHALRAPLASISHAAQILAQEAIGSLTPKQQKYVRRMVLQASVLQDRVNDLLVLNLHQVRGLQVNPSPFNFDACAHEALASRALAAEQKAITLSYEPAHPGITALGDDFRIVHVLENLLDNALRHTPPHGKVTIQTTLDATSLCCRVTDTGSGIAPAALPYLFSPFDSALSAAQDEVGSLGIGLSVCKAIVESHGGRIGAESTAGSGSVFWFTIPRTEPPFKTDGV